MFDDNGDTWNIFKKKFQLEKFKIIRHDLWNVYNKYIVRALSGED